MSWLSRLANSFRGGHANRDRDDELRFHLEERTRDLVKDGLDRRAAAAQAARELGSPLRHREDSREVKLLPWVESVGQDLTYAMRSLRRSPTFALRPIAMTSAVTAPALKTVKRLGCDTSVAIRAPSAGRFGLMTCRSP